MNCTGNEHILFRIKSSVSVPVTVYMKRTNIICIVRISTMRIGKASSVFGRLLNIWKSKNISLPVKVKLYESLIISTLLYGAELWPLPLPVTQMKKLEAAHHTFQRRLLGITWKDKVRNEEIGRKTGLWKLELISSSLKKEDWDTY